jgi:glycosyltransferase involved in cell wall biosynthesis
MAKYSINDIEIFITTHNRAEYLKESISSILNQSAGIAKVTVLDNESTDHTKDIVDIFKEYNVSYIRTKGFLGNFNKAKELVSKPYVMLFHDDDLLHHDYIKLALIAINKYPNISLITTRYQEFVGDEKISMPTNIKASHYLFPDQESFIEHMFFIERIAYAPAIYKTEIFKNTQLEYEKFSKFNDWPFMAKNVEKGRVILFNDPRMFFVRRHDKQDTWTNTNKPSIDQIINWNLFFQKSIVKNMHHIRSLAFKIKSIYFLIGKYQAFILCAEPSQDELKQLFAIANKRGMKYSKIALRFFNNRKIKLFIERMLAVYVIKIKYKNYISD